MDWLTNEIILYIGISLAIISVIISAIYFPIAKVRKVRLLAQLEKEYGEKDTNK